MTIYHCRVCNQGATEPGLCLSCGSPLIVFGDSPTKYKAKPTTVDGVWFGSGKEAKRWIVLKAFEKHGSITNLRRQVAFDLHAPGGGKVTKYVADFTYEEGGLFVVEDSKGFRTALFKLKKRWMLLEHGIQIREV